MADAAHPAWGLRILAGSTLLLAAALAALLLLQPCQVRVEYEGAVANPPELWVDGFACPAQAVPLPETMHLTITNHGAPAGADTVGLLFFGAPQTLNGGPVEMDAFRPLDDGVELWGGGERWFAYKPGRLVWQGYASGLRIPFLRFPEGGSVSVMCNGRTVHELDLQADAETWVEVDVPAGRSGLLGVAPAAWLGTRTLSLSDAAGVTGVTISWLNEEILACHPTAAASTLEFALTPRDFLWALAARLGLLLGYAGQIFYLLAVLVLIGLPWTSPFLQRLARYERLPAALLAGLAVVLLVVSSAIWIASIRAALLLVLALTAGAYGVQRRVLGGLRAGWRCLFQAASRGPAVPLLLAFGVVSAGVAFLPALVDPGWYLGHCYTDSTVYLTASQWLVEHPYLRHDPFEAATKPCYGLMRVVDTCLLATNAVLWLRDVRETLALTGMAVWSWLPLFAYSLLGRLGVRGALRGFGTVLAGSAALLAALFGQNYVSQYIALVALFAALWASSVFLDRFREEGKGEGRALHVWLALVFGFVGALYWYTFYLPVVLFLLSLWQWCRRRDSRLGRSLFWIGLSSLVLMGYNWHILMKLFDLEPGIEAKLVRIAENLVFPYYRQLTMWEVGLGLKPFLMRGADVTRALSALGWSLPVSLVSVGAAVSRLLFLVSLGLAVLGMRAGWRRGTLGRGLVGTVFVYLVLAAALFLAGKPYHYGKIVLTAGFFLLPVLVLGAQAGLHLARQSALVKYALVLWGVGMILASQSCLFIENLPHLLPRRAPLLRELRTWRQVSGAGLREFSRLTRGRAFGPPRLQGKRVLLEGRLPDVPERDQGYVYYAHLNQALRGAEVDHARVRTGAEEVMGRFFDSIEEDSWYHTVLVFHGAEPPAQGFARIYGNETFSLYRPLRP